MDQSQLNWIANFIWGKVGYEISFNRYFYKPEPLRSLEEIRADILALEKETEGLLVEIIGEGTAT